MRFTALVFSFFLPTFYSHISKSLNKDKKTHLQHFLGSKFITPVVIRSPKPVNNFPSGPSTVTEPTLVRVKYARETPSSVIGPWCWLPPVWEREQTMPGCVSSCKKQSLTVQVIPWFRSILGQSSARSNEWRTCLTKMGRNIQLYCKV